MDRKDEEQFEADLIELIPFLRAFARSLCGGNAAEADDVAQEAVTKAWKARDQFEPGTNLKAWLSLILRNTFFSEKRRSYQRNVAYDATAHEAIRPQQPKGTAGLELDELQRALSMLDPDQREAIILVGAGGVSYEEAALICGVPAGTIKSRVSRARDRLAALLAGDVTLDPATGGRDAHTAIFDELESLKAHGPAPRDPSPKKRVPMASPHHRARLKPPGSTPRTGK